MFRSRAAPVNTLEAYDLATLTERTGWAKPVVPSLADLEVVGARVFLAGGTVNGVAAAQPAALVLTTGAIDATWQPPALAKRNPDPSGTPYVPTLTQLATDGQRLYFSGDFERVAGTDRDGVAALSAISGGLDPWDPAPLIVQPLEYTTGGLLMTRPTGTNRVTRRYLAAIDRATGLARPWNPNDSGRVLLHTASPVSAIAIEGALPLLRQRHDRRGAARRPRHRRRRPGLAAGREPHRRTGRQRRGDGRPRRCPLPGRRLRRDLGHVDRVDAAAGTGGGGRGPGAAQLGSGSRRPSPAPRSSAGCCRSDRRSTSAATSRRRTHSRGSASSPWTRTRASSTSRSSTPWVAHASTASPPTARRCSWPASRSARRWSDRPAFPDRSSCPTGRPAARCRRAPRSWPGGSTPVASTTSRLARRRRAIPSGQKSWPTRPAC